MLLQLSRYTFGFFELDHQTLIAKYSETSNRWPVLFPSLNLRREKKRIYWATESMLQRKERENWKVICVFIFSPPKHYSQLLNIMVVFLILKLIGGMKIGLLFDVSLYFVMRVWWSSSKKPKVSPNNCSTIEFLLNLIHTALKIKKNTYSAVM